MMLLTICMYACDTFESDPDVLQPSVALTGKEIYVLSNSASFIDLNETFKTNVPSRIAVTSSTRYGKISDLGSGILQYAPSIGNSRGHDDFEFTVYSLNNEVIKRDTVVIIIENDSTNLPCNIYPQPDYVYNVDSDSVVIGVTDNDIICGNDIAVSVFKPTNNFPPYFGRAEVQGNDIVYIPGPTFKGSDKIMYKIRATNPQRVAYGMVYITEDSLCEVRLNNDDYVFNNHILDSTFLLPVFGNDSLCYALNQYQFNVKTPPAYGQAAHAQNGFIYAPPNITSFPFNDTFTYEVCVDGMCKTADVSIKIYQDTSSWCTIYANPDSIDISGLSATVADLRVLLNDSICGDLKSFKITKQPVHGDALVKDELIKYARSSNLATVDSLRYEICNTKGCSSAGVIIKRN